LQGRPHDTPSSEYEVERTTQISVMAHFIYYVPLTVTYWPWSHLSWCHVGAKCPCKVWTGYDLPFQS